MANHTGSEGLVKIGAVTLGELRSYNYSQTASTIEDTVLTDSAKTYKAGQTTWSGSCDVFWDEADSGQDALTIGAEVTMNFYPEGDTAGDTYMTGTAIVTEISVSAAIDGMVEASISLQGSGALTEATA
jgi:predicted secreted protein